MYKTLRRVALLSLFAASVCFAQEQAPEPAGVSPAGQNESRENASPREENKEVTVPSGTRVALTLMNAIRSEFAHRGDSVRAVTAFPVAVGGQVAIPPGTYVDGTIQKIIKRGASGHGELQIHFTRMVFASGYAVSLDTASILARAFPPGASDKSLPPGSASGAGVPGALSFQQFPPPPPPPAPPPRLGPNPAVIAGISLGATAALIVTGLALHHRHSSDILFEAGSQFEMVLANPLTLDAARVAASASASN